MYLVLYELTYWILFLEDGSGIRRASCASREHQTGNVFQMWELCLLFWCCRINTLYFIDFIAFSFRVSGQKDTKCWGGEQLTLTVWTHFYSCCLLLEAWTLYWFSTGSDLKLYFSNIHSKFLSFICEVQVYLNENALVCSHRNFK